MRPSLRKTPPAEAPRPPPNLPFPTQTRTGEGARLSTNSSLHHANWRGGFVGIASARKWNPDHDEGEAGHHDESRWIQVRGNVGIMSVKYLRYCPIADFCHRHDSSPDQAHQ